MATLNGLSRRDLIFNQPAATNLTLTSSQSDYTILCNTSGAGQTFTLPAAATNFGVRYRFLLNNATAGANVLILVSGGLNTGGLNGYLIGATTLVPCTNQSRINIISGTALIGDFVDVVSTGTQWVVSGFARTAVSFSTTA